MARSNDTEVVSVNPGATYELKDAKEGQENTRVVVFLYDRPRNNVRFAPVGSGREDSLAVDEFLDTYELIAQQGEPMPEDRAENEKAQKAAAKEQETARAEMATNDPTRTNTTRTDLDARAAKRNER